MGARIFFGTSAENREQNGKQSGEQIGIQNRVQARLRNLGQSRGRNSLLTAFPPFFSTPLCLRAAKWCHLCLLALGCLVAPLTLAQTLHFATEDFAPFNWGSESKAEGPMVEVVQAVCIAARFDCKIEVLPWRRALALAEEGRIDGLFAMLKTPERDKKFLFTHPVVRTSLDFFVPLTSNWVYRTPEDLNDMTLVVYGASGSASKLTEMLAQNPKARMETEINHLIAFRKLGSGRYGPNAAVFANRDGASAVLRKEGMQDFKLAGRVMTIDFAIGMSRKKVEPALFVRFNATLAQLQQSGQVRAIMQKYQLEESPPP